MTAVDVSAIGRSNVERPTRLRKATARQAPDVQSKRAVGADYELINRLDWALRPRNPSNQLPAAALARARRLQAARKAFISARNTIIRVATPLYFFVVPVTVRLTAPC